MKRLTLALLLSSALSAPAAAQGYLNAPIYATGYIYVQPGTAVTTNVTNRQTNPNDLNILAAGNITNWTVNLPSPAFDGQIVTIGCPSGVVTNLTVGGSGATVEPGGITSCAIAGVSVVYQYNVNFNTWYVIAGSTAPITNTVITCGGVDDTTLLTSAIALGKPVSIVPANGCITTTILTPVNGQTIAGLGGKATISLVSASISHVISLSSRTAITLQDLTLNGASAAAGGSFIPATNAVSTTLRNVDLISPPSDVNGSIVYAQSAVNNTIDGGTITSAAGAAITLTGAGTTGNAIRNTHFHGSTLFNIHMYGGPSRNLVTGTYSDLSGLEHVGLDYTTHDNIISLNHAEGSGDNGISLSGFGNSAVGNNVIHNAKAGIYSWGSANTITGNRILDNNQLVAGWPCIGANGNFGGTGQSNTIVGNTCDDDQAVPTQLGISLTQEAYTPWSASLSITSGEITLNGLNLYTAGSSGTTGATPPTCTSGTCSDGTITWTYINSFVNTATSGYNAIAANTVIRWAGSFPYSDAGNWVTNTLESDYQNHYSVTVDTSTTGPGAPTSQSATGANTKTYFTGTGISPGIVFSSSDNTVTGAISWLFNNSILGRIQYDYAGALWHFFVNGSDILRLSATAYTPTTDNTVSSGTTIRRWSTLAAYTANIATAVYVQPNLPTISSCGTSPPTAGVGSSNAGGSFTLGTGTPTACTVTFATPYTSNAYCSVTPAFNYTGTYYLSSQSNAGFTLALSAGTSSVVFNYNCQGN